MGFEVGAINSFLQNEEQIVQITSALVIIIFSTIFLMWLGRNV